MTKRKVTTKKEKEIINEIPENNDNVDTGNIGNSSNNNSDFVENLPNPETENSDKKENISVIQKEPGEPYNIEGTNTDIETTNTDTIPTNTETKIQSDSVPIKKKRGRKPGQKNSPKIPTETQINDDLTDIKNRLNDFKEGESITEILPDKKQEIALITGYLFLTSIDSFFPVLIVGVLQVTGYSKKIKLSVNDLQLTKKEFENLEPLADVVAKEYLGKVSPLWAFIGALGGVYAGKIMQKIY